MKIIKLVSISLFCIACSSEPIGKRKIYANVRFASQIDGLYRIDARTQGSTYCYATNKKGETIYAESCKNEFGEKIFGNPEDVVTEAIRLVEDACGGIAKLVGQDSDDEYAGTTPVSCGSNVIGNSISTNCYGGNTKFNTVLRLFYRCEPITRANKNSLPKNDKMFLDSMLKSGKINKNQYDNILLGTPLTSDADTLQSDTTKKEPMDLFLDN